MLPGKYPDFLAESFGCDSGGRIEERVQHHFEVELVSILKECFD